MWTLRRLRLRLQLTKDRDLKEKIAESIKLLTPAVMKDWDQAEDPGGMSLKHAYERRYRHKQHVKNKKAILLRLTTKYTDTEKERVTWKR